MERQPVTSSNVKTIGYDLGEHVLEVEFTAGVYRYYDVPPAVHENLMGAASVGKVMSCIAGAGFRFERVQTLTEAAASMSAPAVGNAR
jgi:hypothetical protein